jgi:hypothetical protein
VPKSQSAAKQAASGRQPRGKKFPEIIPEFKRSLESSLSFENYLKLNIDPKEKLSIKAAKFLGTMPGSKVISMDKVEEGGQVRVHLSIGEYHSEEEFLQKARKLSHPYDSSAAVGDDFIIAAFELLTKGPSEVKKAREEAFNYYERYGTGPRARRSTDS